mgnify:CR=1 FL=1
MTDYPKDRYGRPKVFLEGSNVPVAEIGVECQRERGASSALPPLYFLHVWWARRPLTVSRAAVLGSLLPEGYDKKDFLELMGIPRDADPVEAKARLKRIKAGIEKDPGGNLYGYKRAFTNQIPERAMNKMNNTVSEIWNSDITVLDSFAGGGSIPFEAYRMGFNVILNELNPVATIIEKATIEYPSIFGKDLIKDIKYWGETVVPNVSLCFTQVLLCKKHILIRNQ